MARSLRVALLCVALCAAACTNGSEVEGTAESTTTSIASTSAAPDTTSGEPQDAPTTSTTVAATSTSTTSTDSTASTEPAVSPAYRVAAVGDAPLGLIYWDSATVRKQGHTGELGELAGGPFSEVAEIPLEGIVFQRSGDSKVIWYDGGSGAEQLLVGGEDQILELEGTTLNELDEGIVIYQRLVRTGDPLTSGSTIRAFNFVTKEVREIAITGGWESFTSFSHITNWTATGRWSSEGWIGLTEYDLVTGQEIWDSDAAGLECFDGGCVSFDQATRFERRHLRHRPDQATRLPGRIAGHLPLRQRRTHSRTPHRVSLGRWPLVRRGHVRLR